MPRTGPGVAYNKKGDCISHECMYCGEQWEVDDGDD